MLSADKSWKLPAWTVDFDESARGSKCRAQAMLVRATRQIVLHQIRIGFPVWISEQTRAMRREMRIEPVAGLPNFCVRIGVGVDAAKRAFGLCALHRVRERRVIVVPAMAFDRDQSLALRIAPPFVAPPTAADQTGRGLRVPPARQSRNSSHARTRRFL